MEKELIQIEVPHNLKSEYKRIIKTKSEKLQRV